MTVSSRNAESASLKSGKSRTGVRIFQAQAVYTSRCLVQCALVPRRSIFTIRNDRFSSFEIPGITHEICVSAREGLVGKPSEIL